MRCPLAQELNRYRELSCSRQMYSNKRDIAINCDETVPYDLFFPYGSVKVSNQVLGFRKDEAQMVRGSAQIPVYICPGAQCVCCQAELVRTKYGKWRPCRLPVDDIGSGNVLQAKPVLSKEVGHNGGEWLGEIEPARG